MDEPRFHPLDYLSVVRRRKWWFVVPLVLAIVVGVSLALFLPKEYLSSATVGIAAPAVSSDLARSAGPMDHEERVRVISQQLLSRQVLARVAQSEMAGLAPEEVDLAIARLRANIQPVTFPTPIAPDGNPRLDSFIVSYVDRTPEAAQRVTNRLVEVFVDETTRVRATRAEGTTAFLDVQVRDAQAKLAATEERLRDAKQLNIGRLPEQTGANLQTLNGLRQQLESTNIALRGEQDRLSMVDRQLEAMRQGTEGMPLLRGNGDTAGMAPRMKVQALEQELAAARMTYTAKHPEVIRLQEELASAKAAAAAERARPPDDRLAYLKNDPTYRQLLADQEMGRMRVRELQRAEAQGRSQIALYQRRVEVLRWSNSSSRLCSVSTTCRRRSTRTWFRSARRPGWLKHWSNDRRSSSSGSSRRRPGRSRPSSRTACGSSWEPSCWGCSSGGSASWDANSWTGRCMTPRRCSTSTSCRCWARSRPSRWRSRRAAGCAAVPRERGGFGRKGAGGPTMSRIQRVLDKAEREGQVRRTTSDVPPAPTGSTAGQSTSPVSAQPPVASRRSVPPADPPASPGLTSGPRAAAPPPSGSPRSVAMPPGSAGAPAASVAAAAPVASPAASSLGPASFPAHGGHQPLPIVVPNPVIGGGRRASSVSLHPLLAASLQFGSPTAEQFRALRTRIGQIEFGGRDCRSIVVTSPTPGDGKTVTSSNLALSMAQEFHRKVLLIDADLRKGALHRMFGVDGEPGLTDVLAGDLSLEEALIWIPEFRLTLLPAGRPTNQPTELLGSFEMRRTVDTLRTHFDRIVIDTPPALALADVGVVGPLSDGVLVVVRAGRTPRPAIERALRQVAPARVLGLVLNDVGEIASGYAYGRVETPKAGRRAARSGA